MSSQNIYDQADFFANYAGLDRSVHGLAGAPEWPRLRALLPDLRGRRVLDLGCGFGWFCRWARQQPATTSSGGGGGGGGGAAAVHGVDLSSNMLERARRMTAESGLEDGITYQQADLETVQLPDAAYDVVFSSLALHYLEDLPGLVRRVQRALRPGGAFVFSVEHPILTAPSRPRIVKVEEGDGEGKKKTEWRYWPLDDYQREGVRVTRWLEAEGVRKQHRTAGTYIATLLGAGLELTAFDEWFPRDGELRHKPETERNEMVKPTFLLVRAVKKKEAV